jgi:tellurite resistance protein
MTRDVAVRQDVFLIAADVADQGGIGSEEQVVLNDIAKLLNVDGAKLLG